LSAPEIVPWYMGLLQIIPSAAWQDSSNLAAALVGRLSSGLYIGRSSSRMSRSSVRAPTPAAPSSVATKAARLLETFAIEPPRPTMVSVVFIRRS
jgi:hypothetical protein